MKNGKVVSVEGGCVPGPKKEKGHDCLINDSGSKICVCNKPLCNGVDLQPRTTTTTQNTTTTTQNTTTTTQKTTPTTQKTNGIERLEVTILETLVLIVFVSFLFY